MPPQKQHSTRSRSRPLHALVAGVVLLLFPAGSRAALPVYEAFDYPAGTSIAGQNGGTGWTSAWATGSAQGLATNVAGSLHYTDVNGRSLQTGGGSLVIGVPAGDTGTAARPDRALPVNLSGATTWISFLYQRLNFTPNPYLRQANLGLFEGSSGERAAVGGPNTSATVTDLLSVWGNGAVPHNVNAPFQAPGYPITSGSTYFILVKVVADASAAIDTAYVWFNWTNLLVEPNIATADIVQDEVDLSSVNTLRLQAGNKNSNGDSALFQADELRVGSTFTDVAPSFVGPATPTINTQPADQTVAVGDSASFTVGAGGEQPLSFQWYFEPATPLPNETNVTLFIPSAQTNNAGGYFVVVTNHVGAATSAVATLVVNLPMPPSITTQPAGRTVVVGEGAVFSVQATGQAPLHYQWVVDGATPLVNETNASLTFAAAQTNDTGGYSVVITNGVGAMTSDVANLTVIYVGPPGLPAFPGAGGAGHQVTGGRGGLVYHVTKLDRNYNHNEAGTLRYGLTDGNFPAGVPRTIVFDVAGVFWLGRFGAESDHDNGWDTASRYNLPSKVTLAGQTAPGPVLVMGGVTKAGGDNMIVRNVTFAPGYGMRNFHEPPIPPTPGTFPDSYVYDALDISGRDIMIDHCTAVYATDETISCNEEAANLTLQYCNISQGQNYPQADAEASSIKYTGHALGSLLQAGSTARISVLHNLYAQQKGRLPRVGTEASKLSIPGVGAINDFRNNLFYNWFNTAGTGAGGQPSDNNFINNFYLAGPGGDDPVGGTNSNITTRAGGTGIFDGDDAVLTRVYRSGNLKDTNKDGDFNDAVSADGSYVAMSAQSAAFDVSLGVTLSAEEAVTNVLRHVGSRWWVRDYDFVLGNTNAINTNDMAAYMDERLIHEIATGTGRIMAWADDPFDADPNEGVEWRALLALRADPSTGDAPYNHPAGWDTDGDGMPDTWEEAHGLNPAVADNNADVDEDGYTELEEYLNEVAVWPAPGTIVFTGETNSRYAEIFNWRVTGESVNIAGVGTVPTSSSWQPSRYDTVLISNQTVVVDAVGQHAGTLFLTNNAVLNVTNGWLKVADQVDIAAGCAMIVQPPGRLTASNLTNHGTLRLTGTAVLEVSGSFTNNGVVDIMTWSGALPPGFVNNGTVLDSSVIQINETAITGSDVEVGIQGYEGHGYRLQYSDSPFGGEWFDTGAEAPGAGVPLLLNHTGGAEAPARFYRVGVEP